MSQLIRRYDPSVGPVISVKVTDPVVDRDIGDIEKSQIAQMLIDTGASDSSISVAIAQRLGLPVLGYHQIRGFGASKPAYQFLADLEILLDEQNHVIDNWKLLSFESEYDRIDGLIGRDILSSAFFQMNGFESILEIRF